MRINKNRLLYRILNCIIYLLAFVLGMIVTISVLMTLSTVGMIIERLYHIDVFNWIVIGLAVMSVALMLCIFAKSYLQRFKNNNTYTVGYYDVAENEIETSEYKDLSTAEHEAVTKRKKDGIATIVIIKHTRNRYTNQNYSRLIITYENVSTIDEFKKTIVDQVTRRKKQ